MLNIPRWAQEGGQMYADPRVQHMRFLTEQAKSIAPDIDEDALFSDLLVDDVQYVRPTDQDEKANLDYAPIESPGEFWVMWQAQREADSFITDRDRDDQADWIDPFAEERIGDFDCNDEEIDDDAHLDGTAVPVVLGTSPWQEYADNQRSKMVNDIYAAKAKGKKWADSKALLVVSLGALDKGKSFKRARELGFMAYHCEYAPNILKRADKGFVVKTTAFENGKPKDTWRFFPEEYVRLCWDYLPKASKKRIRALVLGS